MQLTIIDEQVHVAKVKWCSIRIRCVGIFALTEQEKETQKEHVGQGHGVSCVGLIVEVGGIGYEWKGDWFDTVRWWILLGISGKLSGEPEV
jgi:hypothetical protein